MFGLTFLGHRLLQMMRLQGNYPQANPLYRRAIEIREAAPHLDQLAFATLLEKLAELTKKQVK